MGTVLKFLLTAIDAGRKMVPESSPHGRLRDVTMRSLSIAPNGLETVMCFSE